MRKAISPVILFLTVTITGILIQPFSLLQQENLGLFLTTPDFLHNYFNHPLPLSHIAGDFLVQFFQIRYIGAIITALCTSLIFILLRSAFNGSNIIAASASCIGWFFSAFRNDLSILTAILIISIALLIISSLLRKWLVKTEHQAGSKWDIIVSLGIIVATVITVCINGEIRKNECWNKVEYSAMRHDWKKVLEAATPEKAEKDNGLVPYALLALTYEGKLPQYMYEYPVSGSDSFDTEGWHSLEGYFFGYVMYDSFGCPNEALHQLFQASTYIPGGTSFCTLRQLIRLNTIKGDYTLARKYCKILSHSTLHKAWASRYLDDLEGMVDTVNPVNPSEHATAALITHNSVVNLTSLIEKGLYSKEIIDRLLCLLLADGNLNAFSSILSSQSRLYEGKMPVLFQQALSMSGPGLN